MSHHSPADQLLFDAILADAQHRRQYAEGPHDLLAAFLTRQLDADAQADDPWTTDIDAKRTLVTEYVVLLNDPARLTDVRLHLTFNVVRRIVILLAAAYQDRPGYREATHA